MKPNRLWIEIVGPIVLIALAVSLLIAILGAAAGAAAGGQESGTSGALQTPVQQTYVGMVTDTRCGARHSAAIGKTASDCTRTCVHDGAKYALVDGDNTYILEGDVVLLRTAAGHRAAIKGDLTGTTIKVSSLAAAT